MRDRITHWGRLYNELTIVDAAAARLWKEANRSIDGRHGALYRIVADGGQIIMSEWSWSPKPGTETWTFDGTSWSVSRSW